jgi:hypothetical protein
MMSTLTLLPVILAFPSSFLRRRSSAPLQLIVLSRKRARIGSVARAAAAGVRFSGIARIAFDVNIISCLVISERRVDSGAPFRRRT